jgi:hypothetical protein
MRKKNEESWLQLHYKHDTSIQSQGKLKQSKFYVVK